MTYDGAYDHAGPVTMNFNRRNFGTTVTVYFNRQKWTVRAACDARGFDFNINGYRHSGQFSYRPWGVEGLRGMEYVNGRPYQGFSARTRR
jgi:hypothetical protein